MKPSAEVNVILTSDQALVLFEWLTREDGNSRLSTEHQAEQKVLWEIEAQLEKALADPLLPDYAVRVAAARERLVRESGA